MSTDKKIIFQEKDFTSMRSDLELKHQKMLIETKHRYEQSIAELSREVEELKASEKDKINEVSHNSYDKKTLTGCEHRRSSILLKSLSHAKRDKLFGMSVLGGILGTSWFSLLSWKAERDGERVFVEIGQEYVSVRLRFFSLVY